MNITFETASSSDQDFISIDTSSDITVNIDTTASSGGGIKVGRVLKCQEQVKLIW